MEFRERNICGDANVDARSRPIERDASRFSSLPARQPNCKVFLARGSLSDTSRYLNERYIVVKQRVKSTRYLFVFIVVARLSYPRCQYRQAFAPTLSCALATTLSISVRRHLKIIILVAVRDKRSRSCGLFALNCIRDRRSAAGRCTGGRFWRQIPKYDAYIALTPNQRQSCCKLIN